MSVQQNEDNFIYRSQTISARFIKKRRTLESKKIHFGKSNKRNTVYNNIHKYNTVKQQIITIEKKNKQNALRKANLQQQQQRQTTQLTQLCLSKIFRSVIRNPF